MISNTPKLLVNKCDLGGDVICAGDDNSLYVLRMEGIDRITIVDGEVESNRIFEIQNNGHNAQFIFSKISVLVDGNVYIKEGCDPPRIEKINISTSERSLVRNYEIDFFIVKLVNCGDLKMLAIANRKGIWGECLETNELKMFNDENWEGARDMAYYEGSLFLLHNANFYAFNLESKQYTKLLEDLTNEDYANFVIKNGIVYFFGEFPTKMRTFNLNNREREEVDISVDSEEPSKIENLILNTEENVIFIAGNKIWEIKLNYI